MTIFDTERDLTVSRELPATPAQIWKAWSDPRLVEKWWAPVPVKTQVFRLELTPGGAFHSAMTLPDGTVMEGEGCVLEAVENERIVWTDSMHEGFRPADGGMFTAVVTITPTANGCTYTAIARHRSAEDCKNHAEMGFVDGWGMVMDQLGALAKDL